MKHTPCPLFAVRLVCILTFALGPALAAATTLEEARAELEAMHETDQAQRKQMAAVEKEHGRNAPQLAELWRQQSAADGHNIERLEAIIAEHGWPRRSVFGSRAATAAFLILQHSDHATQKKYLPLARAAAAANEMNASSLALLEDRILLADGKKQIYGSQVQRNDAGEWEARPIEDEANVDKRRAAVGLPPLAQYLQGFADRAGGTVANRARHLPAADAPPLAQTLFAATDDDRTAHAKLAEIKPRAVDAVAFQLACRDFCARFPTSPLYAAVRVLAARQAPALRLADLDSLAGWDPADGADDSKLNAEQRAVVAVESTRARVIRENLERRNPWDKGWFEALTELSAAHRATQAGRDAIVSAALNVPPETAIPRLRDLYPNDASAGNAIRALSAIGQPVQFALTTLEGRTITPADFRGKVLLLHFWINSAGTNSTMIRQLQELGQRFAAKDFAIVGVALDRNRGAVESFVKDNPLPWIVVHDERGWHNPIAEEHLMHTTPNNLLVDREGVLRYRRQGPVADTMMRVDALLDSPAAATPK